MKQYKKYRQGDVGLYERDSIPEGFKKEKGNIVALGETTFHKHQFVEGDYQFWTNGKTRYIEVITPSRISHEEHLPQVILPGVYEQIQEREYSYADEEMKTVLD